MSAPALEQLRYEVKFVAHASERSAVLQWVRNHWAGFGRPYPDRRISNVYFDSYELSAFHENLSGTSRRSKVRWRWYGDTTGPDRGTLEVKRRRGGLGWKLAYRTGGCDLTTLPWRDVRATLRTALDGAGRIWLDANPLPVLINRYRRRYFASGDGAVRLTVDWDQQVYDQKLRSLPNLRRRANHPDTLVVEFKFRVGEQRRASAMIQGLPLRLSRNSKYVIGVQSIANG
ncbi:MAG: VTC domain-containing protein [Myxococcota bacterium]|nr:VTC domain-containing protein [Myxococcota bacterium]